MKDDDDDIQEYLSYRDAFPKEKFMIPVDRNEVLEEVAREFEKMTAFEKDTMASFAAFVRGMKK